MRSNINPNKEITVEACAWVAQLESGNLSGSDLAALREWMTRSPLHAKEIREIAALSGQLSILTEMVEPFARVASLDNSLRRPHWRRALASPGLAAAMVSFVFAAGLVVSIYVSHVQSQSPVIYQTAIGEYRTIDLADGSTVKLNTDSQIEVSYTDELRRVRLLNGEALFDVAHNPARPFLVYSGQTVAEAIGTSFVVRLRNKITELAVIEGAVGFSKLAESIVHNVVNGQGSMQPSEGVKAGKAETVVVRAGQSLTSATLSVTPKTGLGGEILKISPREIQRKLSWTEGLFDFSDTPLLEVVEEINRHSGMQIEFVDNDLKVLKLGGIFRTGDTQALLEALQDLDIEVEYIDAGRVQLRKASR